MLSSYLQENDVKVKDGTDANSIMGYMMSIILESVLNHKPDEELGYPKYDCRNKDINNIRNGYSQKTMYTSYGDIQIAVSRDRNGEFEPQIARDYEEKSVNKIFYDNDGRKT